MRPFKDITIKENEELLKYPVYISLLAANSDGKLDDVEKRAAIKLAHTKSFSSNPLLLEYFIETEKVFENNIDQIDHTLPQDKALRERVINRKILYFQKMVRRLGKAKTVAMNRSIRSFQVNISRAHHSVIVDFILPLPIPGLTEQL